MTATIDRIPTSERLTSPPARLSMTPAGSPRGLLDGAWWPRSRDLLRELPALVHVLDARWGRITRVTVNPAHWPMIPRKVPVAGHTVHVGWFAEQDPHKLLLLSYTAGRWDLLVIPPETDAATAARLMAAAATSGSPLTAGALMTNEDTSREAQEPLDREGERETDGGHAAAAAGDPKPPGYMSCVGGM
ncbi:DUF5994 family protein [Streptomyces sp. PmtA]|uniref:DUF5994 family protein n=1 Tax=Streptomyces sp. PmtA TaxID=3074275 RepID=UPI003014D6B1